MKAFDLIVLGGGSGGLAAAQRAAEYGARVALFEPARLGGTCVNVGCVPKKVMWNAAEVARTLAAAPAYGFDVRVTGFDWQRLKQGRDAYIQRLNGIYAGNLERRGIELVRQRGVFSGPRTIVDEHGEVYQAAHVLVATGGYPSVPALPGAEFGMTSDGFFELESLPRRVAVVGSGYVAVELGGVFSALGSKVSVYVRHDRVLRSFDTMLSDRLMEHMRDAEIEIVTGAVPAALRVSDEGRGTRALEFEDGRRFDGFDVVLWAIGRTPNTTGLGLENTSVECTARGHIVVDTWQDTADEGIHAVGDITGQAELTPVAIAAGRRLSDRLFGGVAGAHLSYDVVPTVVFTHPAIGTVGLSEREAVRAYPGEPIYTYSSDFVPMFYAMTETKPRAAMKLIVVGEDERVVGCHIIGPGSDEMLQGFAAAITMGATKRDLDNTIAIHPTSAEELVTLRTRVEVAG